MENSAFDRIVGYEGIKEELQQIIDMMLNPSIYKRLGAKLPHGILLIGQAGTGKTTLCEAFIEEAQTYSITLRKNSSDGDFVEKITKAFQDAKEKETAIILLDDLDKFANEDENHSDADEYVAVQSGIDSVKDNNVLVLATVNNPRKLPKSLIRAGRFDREIKMPMPTDREAEKILEYYMADKEIDPTVNKEDIVKMVGGNVAAVMESIINNAAIMAGAERCEQIRMKHIVNAVLRRQYNCADDKAIVDAEELEMRALHEAGHATVALALGEDVGFVSIADSEQYESGGFIHMAKPIKRRPNDVMICLAGKAACELYLPHTASGCSNDLMRAMTMLMRGITDNGTSGLFLLDGGELGCSSFDKLQETAVKAALERYLSESRDILLAERKLLVALKNALMDKKTLLYSDIKKLVEANKSTF